MKLTLKLSMCVFVFAAVVFAQRQEAPWQPRQAKIDKEVTASAAKSYHPVGQPYQPAAATWVLVDSMTNIFGYGSPEVYPLFYSPRGNILTHVHRGDATSYAVTSGELYYTRSTNGGATWTRCADAFNPSGSGRYPSGSIYYSESALDYYQIAAWPNLDESPSFGDMGYGSGFPLASCLVSSTIVLRTPTKNYGVGQPTWSSDQMAFWAAQVDNGTRHTGTEIWRTSDFSAPTGAVPPSLDTTKIVNNRVQFGGDAIKVGSTWVTAYAFAGTAFRVYNPNLDSAVFGPHTIIVVTSTNNGTTWSAADTVALATIPGLGDYRTLWSYDGSLFSTEGSMVLDSAGYPHIFCGLQKEESGATGSDVRLAEIWKDNTGWKGKLVASANPSTIYDQSVGQTGYLARIARNESGTFFIAQWIDSKQANNKADLYVVGKYWGAKNWVGPFNITNTPNFGENLAHFSPRIRKDGDSLYSFFSSYAVESNQNDLGGSPNRTYVYVGSQQLNLEPLLDDVAAVGIDAPFAGAKVIPDSSFTVFKATFKNNGELDQTDSLDLTYEVFNPSGGLVGSVSVRIPPLLAETDTTVTFPIASISSPLDTGTWKFQAFFSGGDQVASNDTVVGYISVILPGSITFTKMERVYAEFVPLTDATEINYEAPPGGNAPGDDSHQIMALPFPFSYDGEVYDSVMFSTNGWLEFGKEGYGRDSLPFGLSIPSSIDWNNTGYLWRADKPFKVIAPFHEDLNVNKGGDPNAGVFYKTEGESPNRVFTVEWRSMLAYYDSAANTARVTFQLKLYEKTNIIEFHYGPVQPGVWTGDDVGASIGMKDIVGGDYHFFDATTGKGGQQRNGTVLYNADITTIWPGPDSIYRFRLYTIANTVDLNVRWNLISAPNAQDDYTVSNVFPPVLSGTTNSFEPGTGYVPQTTLVPGRGYWAKFPETTNLVIAGSEMQTVSVPVSTGWNLVGSVDHDVAAIPVGEQNVVSSFFGYNNGYFSVSTLKPGKGYWVKVSANGTLNIGPTNLPKQAPVDLSKVSNITIADRLGRQQKLYVAYDPDGKVNVDAYEMPPLPPANEFDARLKKGDVGRMLETYRNVGEEIPVIMQSPQYPLTISYDVNEDGFALAVDEVQNGTVVKTHIMDGSGTVKIEKGSAASLVIRVVEGSAKPKEFALGQNYPNPFNPTTRFNVELPKEAFVQVVVYDILGQKVATLMNGTYEAGYHSIEWNSTNDRGFAVPSGIYFIRMTSEQFSAVRKVMLLK